MDTTPRDSDVEAVFGQLREISRRSNARSRIIDHPLTFVEHSLLRFIATTAGTRATDIATAFALNRSTVSRQINTLIGLGLVHYQDHETGGKDNSTGAETSGRGRILALTELGRIQLASSTAAHQDVVKDRLSGWTDSEIATFAAALARYNEAD
ncbi:DNA-binding transcriptional regulator, MarR family [Arthrobacter alpinus]|uniref:DNA-binding transcriptional regulator, MarR family n=1 Tax=Arthrobacter alpinus TaxID=656366 RepID=A0A1H5EKV7_9MICC|nr:MarR family winged helix-turn-helix transcriptional regulator [Arthrobacter alpinus]SED91715.1 DNA-binding transcriptional regulator, MarR family [Arthrobacter alpinus]